jgi:hypothetical protein
LIRCGSHRGGPKRQAFCHFHPLLDQSRQEGRHAAAVRAGNRQQAVSQETLLCLFQFKVQPLRRVAPSLGRFRNGRKQRLLFDQELLVVVMYLLPGGLSGDGAVDGLA